MKDGKGGGISTSVRQELKEQLILAGEGQGDDEYQVVRLDCYNPTLNIINSYGEQKMVGKEEQEERWGRLRKEMEGIRERGELCVLVGDQKKHVGADHLGAQGNLARVSAEGRLVRDLLATGDW